MIKYSFLFLVLFIVGLLSSFHGQVVTSVLPGWHTTIYPPWFFVGIFQITWLGVVSAIYVYLERRRMVVDRRVFLLHVFLSLFVFLDSSYAFIENYDFERILLLAPLVLFLLGQVLFIVGVARAIRAGTVEQGP